MTRDEMIEQVRYSLIERLRLGQFNADLKDSLEDDEREQFCQVEQMIANKISKLKLK